MNPTTLPDGTIIELVADDEGDDLNDDERRALHAALSASPGSRLLRVACRQHPPSWKSSVSAAPLSVPVRTKPEAVAAAFLSSAGPPSSSEVDVVGQTLPARAGQQPVHRGDLGLACTAANEDDDSRMLTLQW
jgi:hypothetical protein